MKITHSEIKGQEFLVVGFYKSLGLISHLPFYHRSSVSAGFRNIGVWRIKYKDTANN